MGSTAKDVIHISDKEAASDFASLLARVREGAKVIIEHDDPRLQHSDCSRAWR